MDIDFLIVGQGISGTFLSYQLLQRGSRVIVIDQPRQHSPSRVAAGIMNPVTGRRLSTVWKAEEILGYAPLAYKEIGDLLGIEACSRKDIVDIFPNPFMRESFIEKARTGDPYVNMGENEATWTDWLNMPFGYGEIKPVHTAHLDVLLPAWRKYLWQQQLLLEDHFDTAELQVNDDGIIYKGIHAGKLIFCEGPEGMENPYFKALPFSRNKGQALLLRIPGLPADRIYKRSMLLVPLPEKELFWLGASYEWEFSTTGPTEDFRKKAETALKDWIKCDWQVVDQRAGLRPATLERRPFVGLHPVFPSIGLLNGMGTKGCSLAPYFAKELTLHLLEGRAITPEADVQRFSRMLSKT